MCPKNNLKYHMSLFCRHTHLHTKPSDDYNCTTRAPSSTKTGKSYQSTIYLRLRCFNHTLFVAELFQLYSRTYNDDSTTPVVVPILPTQYCLIVIVCMVRLTKYSHLGFRIALIYYLPSPPVRCIK